MDFFYAIAWTAVTVIMFFTGVNAYSSGNAMAFFGIELSQPVFILLILVFLVFDIRSIRQVIRGRQQDGQQAEDWEKKLETPDQKATQAETVEGARNPLPSLAKQDGYGTPTDKKGWHRKGNAFDYHYVAGSAALIAPGANDGNGIRYDSQNAMWGDLRVWVRAYPLSEGWDRIRIEEIVKSALQKKTGMAPVQKKGFRSGDLDWTQQEVISEKTRYTLLFADNGRYLFSVYATGSKSLRMSRILKQFLQQSIQFNIS